jgi:hypothetical protein
LVVTCIVGGTGITGVLDLIGGLGHSY